MEWIHNLLWLLKPEGIQWMIQTGGLPAICLVVFAETGFFALLPGDSLLVMCGIFAATKGADGHPLLSVWALLLIVPVFGILGDQVGYWLGTWMGRRVYTWKDRSLGPIPIFKQAYLKRTEDFYGRWGNFTIVMGRWVPFVRTFAPIVAGVIRMPFPVFIAYNIVGAFTWVWSMVLAGFFLPPLIQQVWPGFDLAKNIDKIAIGIVFLSLLPIFYTLWKERQEQNARKQSGSDEDRAA
jgi:membrane-associated protein